MKLSIPSLLVASLAVSSSEAFSVMLRSGSGSVTLGYSTSIQSFNKDQRQNLHMSRLSMSGLESDFASAMPDKPEQSFQEQIAESATTFMVDLESRLGEGVSAPPELQDLREARDGGAGPSELAAKIYGLLIEQGMLYDQDPDDGTLTPTDFNIKENLEIPEVKQEFAYLYKYGMSLAAKEVVDVETIKEIVKLRLIDRTGLSPEEFDTWLGY
mmetsp:Transcript_274/g.391  ORF Transcript_274/g.391 Transcript_274/m.391 type:complete len:213 (+) Transcript_274:126-764(+)